MSSTLTLRLLLGLSLVTLAYTSVLHWQTRASLGALSEKLECTLVYVPVSAVVHGVPKPALVSLCMLPKGKPGGT